MAKQCPRPGCTESLRTTRRPGQKLNAKEMVGSKTNPIVLRCTRCRKDFEFKGGKLIPVPRR